MVPSRSRFTQREPHLLRWQLQAALSSVILSACKSSKPVAIRILYTSQNTTNFCSIHILTLGELTCIELVH